MSACPHKVTHLLYSSAGGSGEELLPLPSLMLLASSWRKQSTSGAKSGGGPRSNARKGSSAPSSSQAPGSPGEGYAQANVRAVFWQNPVAPPILPPGPSSSAVTALRLGVGTQPASSD